MAALLERFYEPTAGTITLDGQDIAGLDPSWLRGQVIGFISQVGTGVALARTPGCPGEAEGRVLAGAVLRAGVWLQEPVLFGTTIMENIRFGKPGASDAEVYEAARLANADGFIRSFPEGYDTIVGTAGAGGGRASVGPQWDPGPAGTPAAGHC